MQPLETQSLQELLALQSRISARVAEVKKSEQAAAIAKARALIATFDLTAEEVFPPARGKGSKAKVAPKYHDLATGATWTGRGKAPKWIAGQDYNAFLIAL